MSNIRVNTTELLQLLEMTPSSHNIMLVGRHGVGKSEILTEYFSRQGMRVVPLFLGQMADPGDLIGIPNKNEQTGKTEFMPPYWFPLDGKPIVLFLDELNRARPEIPAGFRTKILWVCESDAAYRENAGWMQKSGRVCTMQLC